MSTIYYGQRAYEGFAKAFALRLGVAVSVSGNSNGAYVDSNGMITLPGINGYQTKEEFEITCATVIHEIAHVLYGSHRLFANNLGKPRLWMDCLNAVLDIADETAIGIQEANNGNSRAGELLIMSCVHHGRQDSLKPNPYKRKPNNAPAHWRILASTIIKSRIINKGVRGGRVYGDWLIKEFPSIDFVRVFAIGRYIRGLSGRLSESRLLNAAQTLYEILLPLAPPDGSEQTPMPGGTAPGQQQQKGVPNLPQGSCEATECEGAASGGLQPGGTGAGGTSTPVDANVIICDRGCYDTMLPIVKRIASRLATDGDSIANEGGYSAGMGVREAYRMATDGACMGRWTIDEHADGMAVAILLDCSGSMKASLFATAGVAEAFATGMEECAKVQRWTFSSDTAEVESFNLAHSQYSGTGMSDALEAARTWLNAQTAGKKIIVCLTDGSPNSVSETRQQVCLAISEGVSVIGIALGDCQSAIANSMPMATVISAMDANRLAIALEGITLHM